MTFEEAMQEVDRLNRIIAELEAQKDKVIKSFTSRLKTIKNKACDERVTVKTIYNRAKKGIYTVVPIDGVMFVLEEEKK